MKTSWDSENLTDEEWYLYDELISEGWDKELALIYVEELIKQGEKNGQIITK